MTLSKYAKKAALGRKIPAPALSRDELRQMSAALGRWGGLLNQIAKAANQGGGLATQDLHEIRAGLDAVWDAILDNRQPAEQIEKAMERREKRV